MTDPVAPSAAEMLEALKRALFVLESPTMPACTNGAGAVDLVRDVVARAKAAAAASAAPCAPGKWRVHLSTYVLQTAVVEVAADDAAEAAAKGPDEAVAAAWVDGDDCTKVEVFQVDAADGATVWSR